MGRQRRKRRYADGHGTLCLDTPCRDGGTGPDVPAGVPAGVPLEIAASSRARSRGLLGRTGIAGALLLTPASGIHTFRMRFPIEVAYLDRELRVLAVRTLPPNRLPLPHPRTRHVLEAEAGALTRWGVRPGAHVRIVP
ncbi:DUF192 domain-containing protein [Streptomyces sp. NPDC087440]|uniref:DUF192 domain-containing protein n=1 Tax=Streptomyces sp. NPDC087440 TaxID=3365790 RepID=UPI0038288523